MGRGGEGLGAPIRSRSSSRRRGAERLSCSRSIGGTRRRHPRPAAGPGESSSVRRIRCTRPRHAGPSPWRPKAAIAAAPGRASHRRALTIASGSARVARRYRVARRPRGVALLIDPRSIASASVRGEQRSKSSSKRRRSSCDLAIVAASASRKSSWDSTALLQRGKGVKISGCRLPPPRCAAPRRS